MRKSGFWRRAAAGTVVLALAGAAVLAGLAASLPDTLYTDGALHELTVASMPYLSAKSRQGQLPADSAVPDCSGPGYSAQGIVSVRISLSGFFSASSIFRHRYIS